MPQLEDELESCQEEASLREHQLEATRELLTVLQKHIDVYQHQLDTQSVTQVMLMTRLLKVTREQAVLPLLVVVKNGFIRCIC